MYSKIIQVAIGSLCLFGVVSSAHESTWNRIENRFFSKTSLAATDGLKPEREKSSTEEAFSICKLHVSLVDADTGALLPGLIRATDGNGVISIGGLVNRGLGLDEDDVAIQWYALPESEILELPQTLVTLEAISGIDSELAKLTLDLSGKDEAEISFKLKRLTLLDDKGYSSGNTHVHLKKITRDQADDYLLAVSQADGVDLVFVSYLLRTSDDKTYISNEYRAADLRDLSTSTVAFGFGEEHRNNFEVPREGYGHVMFLDIDKLIHPVSIGANIMGRGPDYPNLKQGIDQAHQQNATVIWCHNKYGHEDIPNWVTGNVHAQNIFDGGSHGSYEDSFYRYLNAGLKIPFSTGTDWFIYDFARVYAKLDKPFSEENWLEALEGGKTFITNGPLLQLAIGASLPGDTISMARRGVKTVSAQVQGRSDFETIELVVNGEVVHSVTSKKIRGHYEAEMDYKLSIDEPSWIALRIPETQQTNELGRKLFAHTSPIYVTIAEESVFDSNAAHSLIGEMRRSMVRITEQAQFENGKQLKEVLDFYRKAILELEKTILNQSTR